MCLGDPRIQALTCAELAGPPPSAGLRRPTLHVLIRVLHRVRIAKEFDQATPWCPSIHDPTALAQFITPCRVWRCEECAKKIARNGASFIVPNCGHWLLDEQPVIVSAKLRDFFAAKDEKGAMASHHACG